MGFFFLFKIEFQNFGLNVCMLYIISFFFVDKLDLMYINCKLREYYIFVGVYFGGFGCNQIIQINKLVNIQILFFFYFVQCLFVENNIYFFLLEVLYGCV